MAISYLCPKCSNLLQITGLDAVNEVGRKYCEGCGANDDNLISVDAIKCNENIKHWNNKHWNKTKEKKI